MKVKCPWTLDEIDKALAERSLWEFVKQAWHVVEPNPFVPGWHIKTVCDHLQAITEGRIRNLIINVPPRHTKSLVVSVLWNAWEWGPQRKPRTRWLCMSYSGDLSIRDSVKCRSLMQTDWYRARWRNFHLCGDVNARERYANNWGGHRVSSSIGGIATGEGGDRIVVDDPHNLKEIHSTTVRQEVLRWWGTVMPTRLNDPKKSSKVIICQRGHHEDLVGHIQKTHPDDYVWLVLPAEYDPDRHCKTPLFSDPRKQPGELLWPERFGADELAKLKATLGSSDYSAQFQQRPVPREGGILKRHWWRFYHVLPQTWDAVVQSWDMAFKDTRTSDFVCGQVWGIAGADKYLLDEVYDRLDFVQSLLAVRNLSAKWPQATVKLVEDKANGPAIINVLRSELPGMIAVTPAGSKESRVYAVSAEVESGNVYLPHPDICSWVNDWIDTVSLFPSTSHDDRVDAFTQVMLWARGKTQNVGVFPPIVSRTKANIWRVDAVMR